MTLTLASALPPFSLNLWQDAQAILSFGFMRQALFAGTILSVVAGLVGAFVVLRHQVFAGEALLAAPVRSSASVMTLTPMSIGRSASKRVSTI